MKLTDPEKQRKIYVRNAVQAYKKSDKSRKFCAIWCYRVVGNYDRGATLGLANDMGFDVPDTVENLAHSYDIFQEMFRYGNGAFADFVFYAWWRAPYIHYSHFLALWKAKNKYDLTTRQVLGLLEDIVQAEGEISSRAVDEHTKTKYGKETNWQYDARLLQKKIRKFLTRPDLPKEGRKKASELLEWIGKNA